MLSRLSHVRLFVTLWTVAHQAPLSMGFSRQEYWSGLPYPPPGDLPYPGTEPRSLLSPVLAGRFFSTSTTLVVFMILFSSVKASFSFFSVLVLLHILSLHSLNSISVLSWDLSWYLVQKMIYSSLSPFKTNFYATFPSVLSGLCCSQEVHVMGSQSACSFSIFITKSL